MSGSRHKKMELLYFDKQKFQHKIVNIFLPINFNMCEDDQEIPQHTFWLRNKKKYFFLLRTLN